MALIRASAPLSRALRDVFPQRPFHVRFWDGGVVQATSDGAPTFFVRRPSALSHFLRAPDTLGLGRAYVDGSLDADDLDSAFIVVDEWEPPQLSASDKARLGPGRRGGRVARRDTQAPEPRADPARRAPHPAARRGGDPLPLRRRQRVLRAVPRRVDDLQLRDLLERRRDARAGSAREVGADREQARSRAGDAVARRRLRVGAASRSTPRGTTV